MSSRERFMYAATRALPPIPEAHGKHDFAIGLAIVGTAAAVALGVWISKRLRRPAAAAVATQGHDEEGNDT